MAGGMTTDIAQQAKTVCLDGSNIVVEFEEQHVCELCRSSERTKSLVNSIQQLTGKVVKIEFRVDQMSIQKDGPKEPKLTRVQMIRKLEQNEMVKSAIEVFDAEVVEFKDTRSKS